MTNSSPSIDLFSGSPLGRYELLMPIAKGGMAQVWAARLHGTRGFQKLVAIKTILSGAIDDARMEEMFLEEAQIASQIHHPNVVGTIDLGEHDGILYLVMEWVDGEPLNQIMSKAAANGGVPLPIGVNLIGQACKGLYAAHNLRDEQGALLGVVHRDVSPQNLLVTFSGTAKLVDFGIAKATSKASGFTEVGEVKGKFAYMAPEQVRAQAVDNRTDLFALGILLYQITTGKHPFRGENPAETVQNICSERGPTPPSAFLPDYPSVLEEVVLRALAKDPERRFDTANDMLTALEAAMPGPLEASFDVQVADYLQWLFGARAAERRTALRVAQERVDQQRAESASSISVGTLRAIAIDHRDSTGSGPLRGLEPVISTLASQATPMPMPARQARTKHALVALAGVLAVACAGLLLQLSRTSNGAHQAGSASFGPLPAESFARPSSPQAAVSAAPALPLSAPGAPAAERREASDDSTSKKRLVRERKAPHGVRLPAAGAALAPAAAAASNSVPPTPVATAAATASQPANTFGRGAFGGRH
jgi:eukaryotic-like serine/threonine-protein kinase